MLDAIAAVENWRPGRVGRAGERGKWQIKPSVWRQYSRIAQIRATPSEERRVAGDLLADVISGLKSLKLPISPYWVALGWRAGLANIANRRVLPEWRDYAQRAENVYATYRP